MNLPKPRILAAVLCSAVCALASLAALRAQNSAAILDDGTRASLNLGGEWEVKKIDGLQFSYPPSPEGWTKETVPAPHSASLKADVSPYGTAVTAYFEKGSNILLPVKDGAAWFRRSFTLPLTSPSGKSVRLHFGGMAFRSDIWLNGKNLGGSLIGQLPQTFDVTNIVRPGANELLVALAGRAALLDAGKRTFLAPLSGVGAGIWGDVRLEFLSQPNVEKIFVNTSVKQKAISLDVLIRNDSRERRSVKVGAVVKDGRLQVQTTMDSPEIPLAPGEHRTVTLKKNWIAPQLWSPGNPALYFLNVSLTAAGRLVDEREVRFGFREFEIRGRDFYLNGVRTVLLRDSSLRVLSASRAEMFAAIRKTAGSPYNCIRPHLGFIPEALLDMCDELGLMVIPESAWHNIGDKFPIESRAAWLPQVEAYTRGMIEHAYNHPSIIMWNLTNESLWGNTDPARMEVADRIVAAARQVDAIRPLDGDAEVSWGGRLPVINIHYPEGSAENTLRAKFANSSFVFPNDFYWLSKEGENVSWRAKFKWDRPLIIGEYWYPSGEADPKTSFMGESVYDWEKWAYQRVESRGDLDTGDNEFVESLKGLTDAYRIQGVAGINPWSTDGAKVMPVLAVRPVDFHPNLPGGETAVRRFVVFNDGAQSYNLMRLQCRLVADGVTLWEKVLPGDVRPGDFKIFDVPVASPDVTRQIKAQLEVRLIHQAGNSDFQLARSDQTVFVMPPPSLAGLDASAFRLLDRTDKTAKVLSAMGLTLAPVAKLVSSDLNGARVIIVGEEAGIVGSEEMLATFAKQGGVVLVLRQREWMPPVPGLPEIDKDHVASRAWIRNYDHPITREMEDAQFSYWRPDHLVSRGTFRKPSAGPGRSLIDSGGLYGLRWSPLVEAPVGQGLFLLSSMPLIAAADQEIGAATLLANLVRFASSFQAAPMNPLRLLAGMNRPLRAALAAAGVTVGEDLDGDGPILVDASFTPSDSQLQRIRSYVERGGSVWLHGFSSQTVKKVAALFPFEPVLGPRKAGILSAARRSSDKWMNNLSSFDFAWCKIDLSARKGYFDQAKAMANLGDEVLQLPNANAGIRLIEPALLVKVPVGDGALLFDTLDWPGALGTETEKATRIVASLAGNLGAEVRSTGDRPQFEYFPVDLTAKANMGYYDQTANDGAGGWTDQGDNDMRFFLINHLGREGGLESGMETEAEVFPEKVILEGRPFWLGDPRKQEGKSIISLRGQANGAKLPAAVRSIPVGRKAEFLWFLQASAWASPSKQEVARYVFHYADGSETAFPIRQGVEVSEWWDPQLVSGATLAWTGKNLNHSPVGIYAAQWKNPHPEKEIASLDVIGDLSPTQFVLLAVTGGVEKAGASAAETIAEWKLQDFDGNLVPGRIGNEGELRVGDQPPQPAAQGGLAGAIFRDGEMLGGKMSSLPDGALGGDGQPFAVRILLSAAEPPPGTFGGIFQAAAYQAKGFRVMLNRDLKVVVEVFRPGETLGLVSHAPLEVGRPTELEVRFDGHYASLLIDGQVAAMKAMPLPEPCEGIFQIGRASGPHYGFHGTISQISLLRLPTAP